MALDVLETAEALLAVAAGEGLCLLSAAGVGVGVGCVALAGSVDAWERHHGGGWVCRRQIWRYENDVEWYFCWSSRGYEW